MLLRNYLVVGAVVAVLLSSGCASYTTPGGPARLADLNGAEVAGAALRQPSPHFPANLAVARVQAPGYESHSFSDSFGEGRFSVVVTNELMTPAQLELLTKWTSVDTVTALDRGLLPPELDSLDDLRLAAAKLQTDILLVYTVETAFQVQGRSVGPAASISLGKAPDGAANISSTASVIFTDVRTGFSYGSAQATAKVSGLAEAWRSDEAVDKKRLEAEQLAFKALFVEAEKTWAGITSRYR